MVLDTLDVGIKKYDRIFPNWGGGGTNLVPGNYNFTTDENMAEEFRAATKHVYWLKKEPHKRCHIFFQLHPSGTQASDICLTVLLSPIPQ